MQIFSFSPFGYEGSLVTVEVDLRRGIPAVDIVGLADGAVKESRERMRSAIRNSGFEFPLERVLISLSPADLRKEGAGFDLAVALGVLSASEKDSQVISENILVMGELELSGKIRGVRGIHAAVSTASASGILYCIVPKANADEAREVDGVRVFAAENLEEAFSAIHDAKVFTSRKGLNQENDVPDGFELVDGVLFAKADEQFDFSLVKNQMSLTRALEIAACGGHNVLAFGPPGCGKTLCMQRFGELLPALSVEEAYPVTRIHSLSGILSKGDSLIRKAPFRMPHQTASIEGICGGGVNCRPGEISLAHNGVLFLDEACEFRSSVLQMLRVPLESKSITLSRAGRSTTYPANFQLLMATNPCPCGNYGSRSKICLCSARSIEMYWSKFSGPLLDRVDIRVKVESREDVEAQKEIKSQKDSESKTKFENEISHDSFSLSTNELRKKIAAGRKFMMKRQGVKNASLRPDEILKYCVLESDADKYLKKEIEIHDFSPRAVSSILKISRTISDMNGFELIGIDAVKEAAAFRKTSGM